MTVAVTVIVSALTSGVISIGTFIVGVRMSKDQGDRAVLRQIYQRLFEHFRALDDHIDDGRPKGWDDFPLKGNRYTPVFRQMQIDGEANLLPSALIAECEQLEADALIAGSGYHHWVRETYIPALKALVSERTANRTSSITGKAYRELSARKLGLMTDEDVRAFALGLGESLGVGLQVAVERGKYDMLHIYHETLNGAAIDGLLLDSAALVSADAKGCEVRDGVHALRPRLAALLARLKKRIRDPHPLHESILRSFRDAFRGG